MLCRERWKYGLARYCELYAKKNDTAPYLTGGIYTTGKKLFTGGRVEIKAKLQGSSRCMARYLDAARKCKKWPDGGEIDIMERLNSDTIAYQTVHSYYTYKLGFEDTPPHGGINKINPDEYNIYSVDIYPDSLVFAINHDYTFTYPRISTDKRRAISLLSALLFADRYAAGWFMGRRRGPEGFAGGDAGRLGEIL